MPLSWFRCLFNSSDTVYKSGVQAASKTLGVSEAVLGPPASLCFYVDQACLNSRRPTCLFLSNAKIKGMHQHTRHRINIPDPTERNGGTVREDRTKAV